MDEIPPLPAGGEGRVLTGQEFPDDRGDEPPFIVTRPIRGKDAEGDGGDPEPLLVEPACLLGLELGEVIEVLGADRVCLRKRRLLLRYTVQVLVFTKRGVSRCLAASRSATAPLTLVSTIIPTWSGVCSTA